MVSKSLALVALRCNCRMWALFSFSFSHTGMLHALSPASGGAAHSCAPCGSATLPLDLEVQRGPCGSRLTSLHRWQRLLGPFPTGGRVGPRRCRSAHFSSSLSVRNHQSKLCGCPLLGCGRDTRKVFKLSPLQC